MEEHFRRQETLVANIDADHFVAQSLVNQFLKFRRLDKLALLSLLGVKLLILLKHIRAHVAVLLLDFGRNLVGVLWWELFTSILQLLQDEVSHVSAGERDVLDAGADNVGVAHWEDMSDTIARIDHSTRQILIAQVINIVTLLVCLTDLGIES